MIKDYRVRALLDLDADELQRRTFDRLNSLDDKESLTVHERIAKAICTERKRCAAVCRMRAEELAGFDLFKIIRYTDLIYELRACAEAIEYGGKEETTP